MVLGTIDQNARAAVVRATTSGLIPEPRLREGLLTGEVFVAGPARGVGFAGEPESQSPGSEASTQDPVAHNTTLPQGPPSSGRRLLC